MVFNAEKILNVNHNIGSDDEVNHRIENYNKVSISRSV